MSVPANIELFVHPKSLIKIGEKNFQNRTNLMKLYYGGLPEDKKNVRIGYNDFPFENAEWYYYRVLEPAGTGYNYWFLLDGPTVLEVP